MLESLLPHIKRILEWISLKRIIMLGLGSIVWIFSLTLFENRAMVFDAFNKTERLTRENTHLKLSEPLMKKIEEVTNTHPEVNFIMVVGASIALNQREMIYWHTNVPAVELDIQDYIKENGKFGVLLSRDDESNVAIIRAINGEFACYNTAKSLMVPNLNAVTKKVCRVSIPPYYGQFSGYLTFGLIKDITPEQLSVLRKDAVEITSEIYFDNLKRLQR